MHVLNAHSQLKNDKILAWVRGDPAIVVADRAAPWEKISDLVEQGRRREMWIATFTEAVNKVVMKGTEDATRGFIAVALAMAVAIQHGHITKITLVGFGGRGHHNDPKCRIGHNCSAEWYLWNKLQNEMSGFEWLQDNKMVVAPVTVESQTI